MGGLGTNHGLATTLFCYRNGLDTTLLLSDQPVTPHVKRHLRLFHRYGAEMVYAGSSLATHLRFYTLERIRRPGAYFLPSGGSTPVGVLGFVNAVFELQSQLEKHAVDEPDYIFCPLGSNGTLAGISLGLALAGMRTKPVGVRVIDSHLGGILPVATSGTVMRLMKRTYRYLRSFTEMLPEITLTTPRIIEDFFGEGYGAPTEKSRRAREVMESTARIPLDPTYTAKTFAAVLDFISAPEHAEDSVLYWHTFSAEERHDEAEEVDYEELPSEFHRFFEREEVAE